MGPVGLSLTCKNVIVIVYEIETVNVIHITVPVIVNTVVRNLGTVHPHICSQIFVVVHYPLISHSHYDIRTSGT